MTRSMNLNVEMGIVGSHLHLIFVHVCSVDQVTKFFSRNERDFKGFVGCSRIIMQKPIIQMHSPSDVETFSLYLSESVHQVRDSWEVRPVRLRPPAR